MNIDVVTYNSLIDTASLFDKTAIVIDVLRCTSVIAAALQNGAEKVIPVLEPEDAIALAAEIGRENCILGGERGCNKLPGFDNGNSPLEYTEDCVGGKAVVISTSNGTTAIRGVSSADHVFLGAISNCAAVAKAAFNCGNDVLLVCSGTNRKPSADDYCAAGAIIEELLKLDPACRLSDIAIVCRFLYENLRSGGFDLMQTFHCKRLFDLGYGKDIEYCMTPNTSSVVPVYIDGEILCL